MKITMTRMTTPVCGGWGDNGVTAGVLATAGYGEGRCGGGGE